MSLFIVLPHQGLAGYSVWPHDALYRPVVGLFDGLKLVEHAVCDQHRPGTPRVPSRLLLRVARRLRVEAKLLTPVPLEGPAQNYWFTLDPAPTLLDRLGRGDPSLRVARLEDGAELATARMKAAAAGRRRTVEDLLRLPDRAHPAGLDGFPFLMETPCEQMLEVSYLDILGRMPDENAFRDYLPLLQSGAWSFSDLRRVLLASKEFRTRPLTSNDRVGHYLTSGLWGTLSQAHVPGRPIERRAQAMAALRSAA